MTTRDQGQPPARAALAGRLRRLLRMRETGLILIILLLFAVMSFASPYFLTWPNMRAMAMAFAVEGIVVVGMTILLISGGIDLSVGSVTALAMVIAGLLFLNGLDPWSASLIAIAACTAIGAGMGFFVTRVGLHHFIVSLAVTGDRARALPARHRRAAARPVHPCRPSSSSSARDRSARSRSSSSSSSSWSSPSISCSGARPCSDGSSIPAATRRRRPIPASGQRQGGVPDHDAVLDARRRRWHHLHGPLRLGAADPAGIGRELGTSSRRPSSAAPALSSAAPARSSAPSSARSCFPSSRARSPCSTFSVYWQDIIRGSILLAAVTIDHYLNKRARMTSCSPNGAIRN